MREIGDRDGEALILASLADVKSATAARQVDCGEHHLSEID